MTLSQGSCRPCAHRHQELLQGHEKEEVLLSGGESGPLPGTCPRPQGPHSSILRAGPGSALYLLQHFGQKDSRDKKQNSSLEGTPNGPSDPTLYLETGSRWKHGSWTSRQRLLQMLQIILKITRVVGEGPLGRNRAAKGSRVCGPRGLPWAASCPGGSAHLALTSQGPRCTRGSGRCWGCEAVGSGSTGRAIPRTAPQRHPRKGRCVPPLSCLAGAMRRALLTLSTSPCCTSRNFQQVFVSRRALWGQKRPGTHRAQVGCRHRTAWSQNGGAASPPQILDVTHGFSESSTQKFSAGATWQHLPTFSVVTAAGGGDASQCLTAHSSLPTAENVLEQGSAPEGRCRATPQLPAAAGQALNGASGCLHHLSCVSTCPLPAPALSPCPLPVPALSPCPLPAPALSPCPLPAPSPCVPTPCPICVLPGRAGPASEEATFLPDPSSGHLLPLLSIPQQVVVQLPLCGP